MAHYYPSSAESRYRTVTLEDIHCVSDGGLPYLHQTQELIEALEPIQMVRRELGRYAHEVAVLTGGRAGKLYDNGDGSYSADLILSHQLDPGELHRLEYETYLECEEPPPPYFRRAVGAIAIERLGIRVAFDGLRLPRQISWAEWEGDADHSSIALGSEEPVRLQPLNEEPMPAMEVYRRLNNVQNRTVGFHWRW